MAASWYGSVYCDKKSNIVLVEGNMASVHYNDMLDNTLEPFVLAKHNYDCWFQQDNSKPYVADHTKEYLTELGVSVLEWPTRIPDFSPTENLWVLLVRDV